LGTPSSVPLRNLCNETVAATCSAQICGNMTVG
jgi:hypothetical protein